MWLASILQQLYFVSCKDRKDSCAVFENGSETGQEWPSPRSFKFFAFRGLPTSMSRWLPGAGHCCHSGIQVGGFGGGLEIGRERQDKDVGVWVPAHSACWHLPSGLWASCQSSACSQFWLPHSLRIMLFTAPPPLSLLGAGCSTFAMPPPGANSSSVTVILPSKRQS